MQKLPHFTMWVTLSLRWCSAYFVLILLPYITMWCVYVNIIQSYSMHNTVPNHIANTTVWSKQNHQPLPWGALNIPELDIVKCMPGIIRIISTIFHHLLCPAWPEALATPCRLPRSWIMKSDRPSLGALESMWFILSYRIHSMGSGYRQPGEL